MSESDFSEKKEDGVVMFCGDSGCCPSIDFTDPETVILKDDFGGKVRLTREQWSLFKKRFLTPSE